MDNKINLYLDDEALDKLIDQLTLLKSSTKENGCVFINLDFCLINFYKRRGV